MVPTVDRAPPPTGRWSTTIAGVRFSIAANFGRSYRGSRLRTNQGNTSFNWRCDSAATVPNTSDDLPDPDTPVTTVSRPSGTRSVTPRRLFSHPSRTTISPRTSTLRSSRNGPHPPWKTGHLLSGFSPQVCTFCDAVYEIGKETSPT